MAIDPRPAAKVLTSRHVAQAVSSLLAGLASVCEGEEESIREAIHFLGDHEKEIVQYCRQVITAKKILERG